MRKFPKPIVVVSRCLEFSPCRYDGQMVSMGLILKLKPYVRFLPVCPEMEIGLGLPRAPIRIVAAHKSSPLKLMQPQTGRDLTGRMNDFAAAFSEGLSEIDGFILKAKSPSCGIRDTKIFKDETLSDPARRGTGLFAREILRAFPSLAVEDELGLNNAATLDYFLTKLFLLAEFREMKKTPTPARFIKFHVQNKMLLMAFHQNHLKVLGKIIDCIPAKPILEALKEYEDTLSLVLSSPAHDGAHENALLHIWGYFKKDLSLAERESFLAALKSWREGKTSLYSVSCLLKNWSHKMGKEYLKTQSYLEPYPEDLNPWAKKKYLAHRKITTS